MQDSLCQGDLLLSCRLVGLGTLPLLQTPHVLPRPSPSRPNPGQVVTVDHFFPPGSEGEQAVLVYVCMYVCVYVYGHVCLSVCVCVIPAVVGLPQSVRLSVLLEAIRNGRIFLLNGIQSMAFMVVAFMSIG